MPCDSNGPLQNRLEITEQTDYLHHIRKMVNDQFFDKEIFDDDPDTKNWKEHVPKPYWQYGNVFSKLRSERMSTQKPYDHAIEFEENTTLPKPGKNYLMSPLECNLFQ